MKHFTQNLRWLFMSLMLVVGVGSAWGTDVTFTAGTDVSSSTSITKDGITLSVTSGTFSRTDNYRVYANNSITISTSSGNITNIAFTFSGNNNNLSGDGYSGTSWSGSSESVTLSSSSQSRITKIVVTYSAGTTTTPTVTIGKTTLEVGETTTVTTNGPTISLTTDDSSIASVSGTTVTAEGAGSATITATWSSGTVGGTAYSAGSKTFNVTVNAPFTPTDGTFDFTGTYDYGSGLTPSSASTYIEEAKTWTAGNVTLVTDGKYRWWQASGGNSLRVYAPSSGSTTLTLSVPSGKVITGISITGSDLGGITADVGTYNNGTWTGSAQTVVFTRESANTYIETITVTYGDGSVTPQPVDPTFAWSASTATATVGETFTAPTLSNNSDGAVTYSSSETSVATIDASGNVTIVAAGTTTITASVAATSNYNAATASYTLTVNPAGTQPLEVTIGLNNTTYGTSYDGSITPINSFISASGTINNVTVEYAKGTGSNAYINNSQTRIYRGNTLTFTAPAGYKIAEIQFSGSNWKSDFDGNTGSYDTSLHTWTGEASSIVFTRSTSDNMQLTQAVVTLVADLPNCVNDLTFTPTSLNLFANGTFTPSGTVESGAGTITYTYECETEGLTVTSSGAYTASAAGTYNVTITATPSNTTDYKAVSTVVEVTVTDAREATVTTFPEASYSVVLGQAFTAPTATTKTTPGDVTLPEGRATYTYTSSNTSVARVDAVTGAVTIIDAGATTITATYAGDDTDYQGSEGSYVLHVTDPNADEFTWDLKVASYDANPTETKVVWSHDVATMTGYQENGGQSGYTAANNYLGGDSNERKSSRFYNHETLTISPTEGNTITSVVFEATTEDYASALANSTWNNATVTVSGTTVTVTPNDGTTDISAAIGATCGFTGVTVHYINASSVAKPVITPATGKYSVRPQTVSITCETDGATIYYTTDGTIPTTSSNVYNGSFTVNRKTTIMAIAVKDGNQSRTASVDISFEVTAPVFNYPTLSSFNEEYTVEITAQSGVTIYYITQSDQMYVTTTGTTNDPTSSIIITDAYGNPKLVSSARVYSEGLTFSQAMMITAVAVDADGNQSDPVTVEYQYTGTVGIPYTSRFASTLGDFTSVSDPTTSTLGWRINTNKGEDAIAKWGEERAYAYITGRNYTSGDKASLTSPIFDLTNFTEASFSFIHAGAYFETIDQSQNYCKVYVDVIEDGSTNQVSVPGWYTLETTSAGKPAFTRANSGDIDLTDYAGKKIQIRFEFTVPNDVTTNYGTWNVDQVTVLATKAETETEKAAMNSKGWTTYVFDHDIDAYQTTANYTVDGVQTLKIFKVTEFDHERCVLQQLGLNETHVDGVDDSERYIKAKTPVVINGPAGETIEYVIYSSSVVNLVKHNLLLASLTPDLAVAPQGSGVRYFVLQWNNSTNQPWFNKVSEGREIPDHRAYLNGTDQMDAITTSSNPVKGIYVLGEDWETTAIDSVSEEVSGQIMNGEWYTLQGVRVDRPTERGIYIVNGKKVLIK